MTEVTINNAAEIALEKFNELVQEALENKGLTKEDADRDRTAFATYLMCRDLWDRLGKAMKFGPDELRDAADELEAEAADAEDEDEDEDEAEAARAIVIE